MTTSDVSTFGSQVVRAVPAVEHFVYLQPDSGDWLASASAGALHVQPHVDDAAVWRAIEGGYRHPVTGLTLHAARADSDSRSGARCTLAWAGLPLDASAGHARADVFSVSHGPAQLPSASLAILRERGWVALVSVLAPDVVDGLQQLGGVDAHEHAELDRGTPQLLQHAALSRATAEPVSAWLCRQYMGVDDIKLGHPPSISALTPDDGARAVQGWHIDFPYLGGTGTRVPVQSGAPALGMQRNICVSDFRKENGATVFVLGSHASGELPPRAWGWSSETYQPQHRALHGLPHGGPDTQVIEAPAGSILLYDARTWHRAGVNLTGRKRGACIQAIVPGFIVPFMDMSALLRAWLASDVPAQLTARERADVEELMTVRIAGPGGVHALGVDAELSRRIADRRWRPVERG